MISYGPGLGHGSSPSLHLRAVSASNTICDIATVCSSKKSENPRRRCLNLAEMKTNLFGKTVVSGRPMQLDNALLPGLSPVFLRRTKQWQRLPHQPCQLGCSKVRSTHMLFSFMAELEGGEDTIGQYLKPPSKLNPLKTMLKSYLNAEEADREKETGMTFRRTVYDSEKWVRHRSSRRHQRNLLSIGSSRVILALGPPVFAITCIASVMAALNEAVMLGLLPKWWPILHMSALPFQLTAPALALLLVFRTNASYARFDEARRLWANVVVRTRDTIRMALAWIVNPIDFARRRQLLAHVVAFSMCLKYHLTKGATLREELEGVLEPWEVERVMAARHKPNYILQQLAEIVPICDMTEKQKEIMDKNLTYLNECTGACERIYSTPIPLSYTRLTSRFLVIWHATLPLGLWDQCKWAVIPATFFSAAALLCIEEVGVLIEEPFSILALSSFCGEAREALDELVEAHEVINSTPSLLSDTVANPSSPSPSIPSPTSHSPQSPTSHATHSPPTPTPTPSTPCSNDSSLNGRTPPSSVNPPQEQPASFLSATATSLLAHDDASNFNGPSSSLQTDAERSRSASTPDVDCGPFYPSAVQTDADRSNYASSSGFEDGARGMSDERPLLDNSEAIDPCSVSAQISTSIASLGSATACNVAPDDLSVSGSKGPGAPRIGRRSKPSSPSEPPPSITDMPMHNSKRRRRKHRFR